MGELNSLSHWFIKRTTKGFQSDFQQYLPSASHNINNNGTSSNLAVGKCERGALSNRRMKSGSIIMRGFVVTIIIVVLLSCQLNEVKANYVGDSNNVDTVDDPSVEYSLPDDLDNNDDLEANFISRESVEDEDLQHYSHQWAAHIIGGNAVADGIARKHGFINTGEIFPDYYHLVHRKVAKRSLEAHHGVHGRLARETAVRWAEQQRVKRRSKRDFLPLTAPEKGKERKSSSGGGGNRRSARRSKSFNFNDPRWTAMWYLNRGAGLDMNVIEAWNEGITGKGIVVTILDDGLEHDHPDIVRNYDPMASFDVNSLDMNPMPTYDLTDSNRHGTRCAGEVAAEANNSICAVGIAYEAGVGGVRMLDGDVTDAVEARSLSHNPQHIDIYSASWGPDDDGKTVDGPGELATRAFQEGISKGRNGKGSIFVWASGNGGRDHDNCNCDGYTNSIWTLSISSATENGLVPWYSEACSSTLATTYSSGGTGEKQIVTIDLHHSCTQSHTGTSASAPLAAGICALALQANTNLTWRDMQHIVVRTARPTNLIAPDWATNGVGRNVSHSFGYGLMDAGAMVKLAKKWRNVPEQHKCEIKAPYTDKNIPAKSKVTLDLKVTDCPNVRFLEHVQAKVTLMSGRRGDLLIYLVSPSGTRSVLLAHRRHDLNRSGFTDWPFMTVHAWGESPMGKWTLEIHNEGRYADHKNGKLQTWTLVAHGITDNPNDQGGGNGSGSKNTAATNIAITGNNPSVVEFDGSDNSIGIQLNHVQNNPLAANSEMAADSSLSILSTSVASSPSSSECAKMSNSGQCLECRPGFALLNGHCLTSCPDGYFPTKGLHQNPQSAAVEAASLLTYVCIPCHYSCKTCSGQMDYECRTCFGDSKLHVNLHKSVSNPDGFIESHCYPESLLNSWEDTHFWYKVLLISLVVNVIVVILLVFHVCTRNGGYSKVRNGSESQGKWYRKGGQPYTRVSPDEINPSGDEFGDSDNEELTNINNSPPYEGHSNTSAPIPVVVESESSLNVSSDQSHNSSAVKHTIVLPNFKSSIPLSGTSLSS